MAKNRIYIPTFISSVNYAPARVLPHIYFYNGMKACEQYYVQGYLNGNTGSVVSQPLEAFPYFDNYEGQDPQSGSRSLLFNNEPAVYGTTPTGSLYSEYWETYVSLLYNPRTRLVNCEAIIPLADYFKMELNDICEWRGNYYHLRAINEYNLTNGECKLQLLGPLYPPVISNLLPELDCGFNFTSSVLADVEAYTINFRRTGEPYLLMSYKTGSNGVSTAVSMSLQNSANGVDNWIDTTLTGPIGTFINTLNNGDRIMNGAKYNTTVPTGSYYRLKQTNSDNSLQYSGVQFLSGSAIPYQTYICNTSTYAHTTSRNDSFANLLTDAGAIWSSGTGTPAVCFQIIKYIGAVSGSYYPIGSVPTGCNDINKCI